MEEYADFSEKMGLPQQMERVYGASSKISIAKNDTSDIINSRKMTKEVEELKYIGKLDRNKLGEYKDKVITDDVILTNERLQHIKEHHPGDYEHYGKYIKNIIEDPDYILDDTKNIDTVLYMKNIIEEGKNIQLVIKLSTNINNENNKNSVLTLWKIKDKTFRQFVRNKKKLYIKE